MSICYQNQLFSDHSLPSFIKNAIFRNCTFKGRLPDFIGCEFHDCTMTGCIVGELVDCALFSTNLDRANFSNADVRFSITNAGSPCSVRGAEWQGVSANLDCGWWQGLEADERDAEIFLIMALLPKTPLKRKLYRTFSPELRTETDIRTQREWRKSIRNRKIA